AAVTSARRRSRRSTTRTPTSCAGTSRRRARSGRGASPARADATSGRSRLRSSERGRWRSCPTSRTGGRWRSSSARTSTRSGIADELWTKHKVRVDRRKIAVDSIKRIGRYQVPIELFQDVTVDVRTLVVPEGGALPPEEELEAMEAAEQAEQQPPPEEKHELDLDELDAAARA